MHKSAIPQYILDRVQKQRGALSVFDDITPLSTALLVVDLQNAFMLEGMQWEILYAREILPDVNRLAAATRKAGARVVWLQMTLDNEAEKWSVYFDFIRRGKDKAQDIKTLSRGTHGHALHADCDVQPEDILVEKTRYSAFIQGSSELDKILREMGIDTLFIVGTVTNGCCECTARDAMMLNYKVIMISDGNAARTDEEHNGALSNILRNFGDVISTDQAVERLDRASRKSPVPLEPAGTIQSRVG